MLHSVLAIVAGAAGALLAFWLRPRPIAPRIERILALELSRTFAEIGAAIDAGRFCSELDSAQREQLAARARARAAELASRTTSAPIGRAARRRSPRRRSSSAILFAIAILSAILAALILRAAA